MKFRQVSNCRKEVFGASEFAYTEKKKVTSEKFDFRNFRQIANNNKSKSTIPPLFNGLELLSVAYGEANFFVENFFQMTRVSLYLLYFLGLNMIFL